METWFSQSLDKYLGPRFEIIQKYTFPKKMYAFKILQIESLESMRFHEILYRISYSKLPVAKQYISCSFYRFPLVIYYRKSYTKSHENTYFPNFQFVIF